jgi:AraC-like DNA-binding protein
LLAETDRSVADIAYACGFYDHSAMTRAFRSATNQTPSQFRTLTRNVTARDGDRNDGPSSGG